MNLIAITDVDLPVTVADAKANMRIEHSVDDDLIQALILSAAGYVENPHGKYGYALTARTWQLALDAFPAAEIKLPAAPVASVTSVKYTDPDGAEQTVSPDDYDVDTYGNREGWVVPVTDFTWPVTMDTFNSVRVRWVAGVGCPVQIRQAILLMVGNWYEHREAGAAAMQEIPFGATALLAPWRRWVAA